MAGARVVHPLHRRRRGHEASQGATGAAPEALDGGPPLVYSFHFPFAEGWCDPATGAARVAFTGTVRFRYSDHEIDLVVNDPEVELDGPASRVIFRMTGSGDTAGGNKRAVVETLDVSKASATATAMRSATSGSRARSRRAPPARSSPATTSRAIRSGGSRHLHHCLKGLMRTFTLALAATALLATAPAASAADYTVTGGKLDWTIANYFTAGDPARTWLGYATNTARGRAAAAATSWPRRPRR